MSRKPFKSFVLERQHLSSSEIALLAGVSTSKIAAYKAHISRAKK